MLNISQESIQDKINQDNYPSLANFKSELTEERKRKRKLIYILLIAAFACFFLPWTQNIQSPGYVTSLRPENRPQEVHSVIAGRIESWFVQEGRFVKRGDTLLRISEIKDKFFDPQLLERTSDQLEAKKSSVIGYKEKVLALEAQIEALEQNLELKLQQATNKIRQARLKVVADSMDWEAAKINLDIAEAQFDRQQKLFDQGLKSKTELEKRRNKLQESRAKATAWQNKYESSRNDEINAKVEYSSIGAQYRDKLAKARSDRYSALTDQYTAEGDVAKLENSLSNFEIRQGFYYILAPQDGYVTQARQTGIGQTIKEGERVITIMPAENDLAVEMYVKPLNLPLLNVGQEIRIQFDGWPAIIFSGWPGVSTGTFAGEIVAIDRFADAHGKYRVLVKPKPGEELWPEELRVGGGAKTFALLNDVLVIYEIWRQINGFPADYYQVKDMPLEKVEKKKK